MRNRGWVGSASRGPVAPWNPNLLRTLLGGRFGAEPDVVGDDIKSFVVVHLNSTFDQNESSFCDVLGDGLGVFPAQVARGLVASEIEPAAAREAAVGGEDVSLLAVHIVEESDAGVAVRVVLDRSDLGDDVVLGALEVDDTIPFLMTATQVAHGHFTGIVTSATLLDGPQQGLLRSSSGSKISVIVDLLVTLTRGRGFILFNCHLFLNVAVKINYFTFGQCNHCLLV